MRRDNSFLLGFIWFLAGALTCYILVQFSFLEIDAKVNVTETIVGVGTAAIGLYIASTLQKSHNRNTKLSEYLQHKLDSAWDNFFSLSEQLHANNTILLTEVTKTTKKIEQSLYSQKKILAAFELDAAFTDEISTTVDRLEDILVNRSVISSNIINYAANRAHITQITDDVSQAFANALRAINRIN